MADEIKDRVLCPDEMCVGIIGPSGRCGVCGKPGPQGGARAAEPEASEGAEEAECEPEAPIEREPASSGDEEEFDPEKRVLCADELCTGIVGANGRCGICGRELPAPT